MKSEDLDNSVIEAADYSAYGVPSSRYGSFSSDNRFHLGLEWQPMKGIYGYYNNARFRDAILAGSFYQCDPLAEKYYSLSPYSWCAGNPMKYTDERGDTISVLHLRGSIGHLALLIQNIDGKWAYYSYNGTPIYEKTTGSFGGKQYHDLGSKTFNSPEEFMNSTYNREGSKEEVRNDEINNYGYNEAYTIPTDSEQDNKIRSAFQSEAKKPYNLLDHQCAQVVQLALNAGGISTKKIFDIEFNILGLTIKRKIDLYPFYPFTPADTFETIRQTIPNYIAYGNKKET